MLLIVITQLNPGKGGNFNEENVIDDECSHDLILVCRGENNSNNMWKHCNKPKI
jgi:hypothetical protein